MSHPLIVANWKMHKTVHQSIAFAKELLRRLDSMPEDLPDQVICPTLPALFSVASRLRGTPLRVGAQTLDLGREGANTGAVSAYLVREAGADFVILGHSERRSLYGEDDALVAEKTRAAWDCGLMPIVCVGESPDERKRGATDDVIRRQVSAIVETEGDDWRDPMIIFAYEPLWAIGTGEVASPEEADRVAALIRDWVGHLRPEVAQTIRILYGGSVKAENAAGFAASPHIDGALVGGASLDVDQWLALIQAWREVEAS